MNLVVGCKIIASFVSIATQMEEINLISSFANKKKLQRKLILSETCKGRNAVNASAT